MDPKLLSPDLLEGGTYVLWTAGIWLTMVAPCCRRATLQRGFGHVLRRDLWCDDVMAWRRWYRGRVGSPRCWCVGMPPGPAMVFEGGIAFSSARVRMSAKLLGWDAPFHLGASHGGRRWLDWQQSSTTSATVGSAV